MTTAPLAYEEIKQDLLDRIGRRWPAGSRLPAVAQLARELDAGQRNTLRAIQELAQEGYLRSRPGRGTFVAAQLPKTTSRRAVGAGKHVGIIVHLKKNDRFIHDMFEGLSDRLDQAGFTFEATRIKHRTQGYDVGRPFGDTFDAVALINPDPYPIRFDQSRQQLLVISTSRCVNVAAPGGYDFVGADEDQGCFLAARRMREAGCRSAAFLGASAAPDLTSFCESSVIRLRAFEAGWGESIPPEYQICVKSYAEPSGARGMAAYQQLERKPDGVFTASDEIAVGFALGGLASGLEPGRDYKLIGFDGQERARSLSDCPPICSVEVPARQMGERGAQLLIDRTIDPARAVERVMLGCRMYEGETATPENQETDS